MAKITLTLVHPMLDGTYDFDEEYLTNFELHAIKMATGLTAGELEDVLARRDNDANVALALVALIRAGKITSKPRTPWLSEEMDALWNARIGAITGEEEVDASPPSTSANGSASAATRKPSGETSNSTTESPEPAPRTTGTPA